jgi:hypothetical protein
MRYTSSNQLNQEYKWLNPIIHTKNARKSSPEKRNRKRNESASKALKANLRPMRQISLNNVEPPENRENGSQLIRTIHGVARTKMEDEHRSPWLFVSIRVD